MAMPELVQITEKFQVTIPVSFRKAARLEVGDDLEASVWGEVVLLSRASADKLAQRRKTGITAFLHEERAAPRSRADIDGQGQQDRNAWDQK